VRRALNLGFFVILAALVIAVGGHAPPAPPRFAPAEYRIIPHPEAAGGLRRAFLSPPGLTRRVHSGTLVETPDGGLLAAWFGGSREGAADVAIYGARRPAGAAAWSAPFVITDRAASARDLGRHLRKLGNPVLARDRRGRIHLFYVQVSMGGWSTSRLAERLSSDGGRHWGPARGLVTSPFLNISTLVRTRPLALADGGLALPVYHELAGKFGEWLRLDADGRLLAKHRIGWGRRGIQPSLVARGPREVVALLRRVGGAPPRVLRTRSTDGGRTWGPLEATDLPNPDASVAALGLPGGDLLLAYNHAERGRANLSLARSRDGLHWRRIAVLEDGAEPGDEFSYPYLIRDRRGRYQLIYTWRRRRMAWISFDDAWLARVSARATPWAP